MEVRSTAWDHKQKSTSVHKNSYYAETGLVLSHQRNVVGFIRPFHNPIILVNTKGGECMNIFKRKEIYSINYSQLYS